MPVDLEATLQRRTPRKLAVEANTRYDVFINGENLVLMVSSAVGYEANAALFRKVRDTF